LTLPLECAGKTIHGRKGLLIELDLFNESPDSFRERRYKARATVDGEAFTEFCETVTGEAVTVTKGNGHSMEAPCVEFGLHELDDAIAEFGSASPSLGASQRMNGGMEEDARAIEEIRSDATTSDRDLVVAMERQREDARAMEEVRCEVAGVPALTKRLEARVAAEESARGPIGELVAPMRHQYVKR